MATNQSIAPFPDHIDRSHFGSWFSGFTDGEGCFVLCYAKAKSKVRHPRTMFSINLRSDDKSILYLIQSYFQRGQVLVGKQRAKKGNSNPCATFRMSNKQSCKLLIDHFDTYPLMAKKARDFMIWKEGCSLISSVHSKPFIGRGLGGGAGWICKWTNDARDRFEDLRDELRCIRKFTPMPLEPTLPAPKLALEIQPLFDW